MFSTIRRPLVGGRAFVRLISSIADIKLAVPPSVLNLRVGQIINIKRHENADKLYVSQIQVEPVAEEFQTGIGQSTTTTPKILQVCSGLVDYIPQDNLLNSKVVLITNLKPSKMRGVKSEAMLLAASSKDNTQVELVNPPNSLALGTELYFQGFKPAERLVKRAKGKQWEEVSRRLKTDHLGRVVFVNGEEGGCLLRNDVNDDVCSVRSLKNCTVR